jgi:hypothetical protein
VGECWNLGEVAPGADKMSRTSVSSSGPCRHREGDPDGGSLERSMGTSLREERRTGHLEDVAR